MKKSLLFIIFGAVAFVMAVFTTIFVIRACNMIPKYFTITFVNYDDSILEIDKNVKEGSTPLYNGVTPIKDNDDIYVYRFVGWDKELLPITKDETFKAVFLQIEKEKDIDYTITFVNYDGTILYEYMAHFAEMITYKGATPVKMPDAENGYLFDGWDMPLERVLDNTTFTATYKSTTPYTEGLVYDKNCIIGYTGNSPEVIIPTSYNGYEITKISDRAFYGCNFLETLIIPNTITSIGDYAFNGCVDLKGITIPGSVKSIGDNAFLKCEKLLSVRMEDGIEIIGNWAFAFCENLSYVSIPGTIKYLGGWAFIKCLGLTEVKLGRGLTEIGQYAFNYCENITSIYIPSTVTTIGEEAFRGNTYLTIYCEASEKPSGWHNNWNYSNLSPVHWGVIME